jgi:hypothetical protein
MQNRNKKNNYNSNPKNNIEKTKRKEKIKPTIKKR